MQQCTPSAYALAAFDLRIFIFLLSFTRDLHGRLPPVSQAKKALHHVSAQHTLLLFRYLRYRTRPLDTLKFVFPGTKKNGICCIDNSYKDTFIIAIIYSAKCVYIMCLCMCDTADTRRGSKKKTYYDSAQRQNLHHLLLLLHITFVSFLLKWLAVQRPRRTICGRNRLGSINLMYVGFVIFLLLTSAVDVFLSLQNLSAVCVCVFVGLLLFNSIMLWLLLLLLLLLPRLARSLQGGKRSVVVDRF